MTQQDETDLDALLTRQRETLGPDHIDLAASYDRLAQASQKAADFAMMFHYLEQALAIRRKASPGSASPGGDPEIGVTLSNLAVAAAQLDRFADARAALQEAVTILREIPGQELRLAQALDNLGPITAQLGDTPAARQAVEEALAIRLRALGDNHPQVASSLQMLASLALQDGDHAAAEPLLQRALAIRRTVSGPEHFSVGALLSNLGDAATQAGEDRQALAYHEQALAIRQASFGPAHPLVGFSLNLLAKAHHQLGDYQAARQRYAETLDVFSGTLGGEHLSVANTLSDLAGLHRDFGQFVAAKESLERALIIQRRVLGERHRTVAGSLVGLGALMATLGDFAAAEEIYATALDIARETYDERHWMIAGPLDGLALLADRRGDGARAAALIEEGLAIRRDALGPRHPETAISLRNRGLHRLTAGDPAAAIADLKEAVAIRTETLGPEHPDVAACHVDLAGAHLALGQLDEARRHAERALAMAASSDNPNLRWEALSGESRVLAMQGATAPAIYFGKAAVTVLQRLRVGLASLDPAMQQSFVGSKEQVYRHLAGLLIDAGRLAEAQTVLAMLKEEEFFDLIRRDAGADPRLTFAQLTGLEAEWQRHGDEAEAELATVAAEAARLRGKRNRSAEEDAALRALRGRLDAAGRRFDAWLADLIADLGRPDHERAQEIAALNLQTLQAVQSDLHALGVGVVLLHFLLGPERLAIIVTAPGLQASREVAVGERVVNRLVHELRFAIENRTDDLLPVARTLYRHLIAPIRALLDELGARTLLVVLDGVIRYAPLAALHDGTEYLAERYALAMLTPAAQTRMKDQPTVDWRLAGLGVSREIPGYARLAAVQDELSGIVRVGEADRGVYPGTIYLDDAFTEDALMEALDRHEAIHVASHFVFAPGNELASHLLLGNGAALTLERLKDRSFDFGGVELIALSACETAMGGGRESGREIEGFGALLQKRGARAVIATLWPVADASTPMLMRDFYHRRRTLALPKAEALRQAQLSLLRGDAGDLYAHPYHWAPFILMGNAL